MIFKFKLFFLVVVFVKNVTTLVDIEALRECGNLHHLEFKNLPNPVANFSNDNCRLKCATGKQVLSDNAINEGYACPTNLNGVKC